MDTDLRMPATADRAALYAALIPRLHALLHGEQDPIALMANTAAAIQQVFGWHWVGFYRVIGNELVLGPFVGPVACIRIAYGKGVCGSAWAEDRTLVVPDVDAFPGHIACSPLSRSELVIPLHNAAGDVVAVLDIDSSVPDDLSERDAEALTQLCAPLQAVLT